MKAYPKGEHVLRVEAICHNTRDLNCGRDQVIAPILAGVRSPRLGRKPATWTSVDRAYEQLRITMHKLLADLAIDLPATA